MDVIMVIDDVLTLVIEVCALYYKKCIDNLYECLMKVKESFEYVIQPGVSKTPK